MQLVEGIHQGNVLPLWHRVTGLNRLPKLTFIAFVKNLYAGQYAKTLIRSHELHPKLLSLRTPSDPQPVVVYPIGARGCA